MKQPKKLTRNQKECLMTHKLNPKEWGFVAETDFHYKIVNRSTGAVRSVDKFVKGDKRKC